MGKKIPEIRFDYENIVAGSKDLSNTNREAYQLLLDAVHAATGIHFLDDDDDKAIESFPHYPQSAEEAAEMSRLLKEAKDALKDKNDYFINEEFAKMDELLD